jgi:spermidine synthase
MVSLFRDTPALAALNRGALSSPRVRVVNADAFRWIRAPGPVYDVILVDFPDPTDFALGKLYSESFYRALRTRLAPDGIIAVQSTSPFVAPRSFWAVATTLEAAGFATRSYHAYVPSFGEWGFTLAARQAVPAPRRLLPPGLRFLDAASEPQLFQFPPDMARRPARVNRLDNQSLVTSFAQEWGRYGD